MRWTFLALLAACGGRTGLGVGQHSAADAGPPSGDAGLDAISISDAPDDVPAPLGCASGLVKIADTGVAPDQLVLDGGFLYWHDRDGISRVQKAGGAVQPLAKGPAPAWPELAAFALSNTDVYFAFGPQITMVSKQGGPPTPLPIPIPNFPFVATGKTMLYAWSGGLPGPLFAAPLGGGPAAPIANLPTAASKIVVDGNRGYTATDGGVQVVDLGTGTVMWLSGLGAADVAVDASDVYFTTIDTTNGAAVMRVPKTGGQQSKVLAQNGAYAVALSATDLYFAERLDMLVRKVVGKTSPNVVTLASFDPTSQPIALALDGQCVYVTVAPNAGPGAIYGAPL